MKAKEWVERLYPLHPTSQEFQAGVTELQAECTQILATRIKGIENRLTWMKPDKERWTNAFREAGVKWDAVVHGVALKRAEKCDEGQLIAPYPLFKGMLLWKMMSQVVEDIAASSYVRSESFEVLRGIAQQLGYQDIPVFRSLLAMGQELKLTADFSEMLQIYTELAELQRKHTVETLTMADMTRLGYLNNRWRQLNSYYR